MDIVSVCLNVEANHEEILYRLKQNTVVHIYPNIKLIGHNIVLYTNYPCKKDEKFKRTNRKILDWFTNNGKRITNTKNPSVHVVDTGIYAPLHMKEAGTFRFWFYKKESQFQNLSGGLYIQIEPCLHVGPAEKEQHICIDSIRCQTVISKLLGDFNTWDEKLRVSKESGYNVIHFTPIQELGNSRSAYSIRNHLAIDPSFTTNSGVKPTFDDIKNYIKKLRKQWHVASICDIVLNHVANESDLLIKCPGAAYSCSTCPYLRPAFLLDALLSRCSKDVSNGLLEIHGIPSIVDKDFHLDSLKHQLIENYLPKIRLYELYQCNVEKYVQQLLEKISVQGTQDKVVNESNLTEIQLINDPLYRRFGATIDIDFAVGICKKLYPNYINDESQKRKCTVEFRQHLKKLNEEVQVEINGYLHYAIDNCLAGVRSERVNEYGMRIREISDQRPLFMKYFTQNDYLDKSLQEVENAMYCQELGKRFMAHNGWVMGATDVLENFADEQPGRGNVYLKRELIAWSDSVKLRYGKKPSDNPYLWQSMSDYIKQVVQIFDGIRLDNCHSTPLCVGEYFMDLAREIKPNLYVVAELFTNSSAIDNIFISRLGITSIIREAQSVWYTQEEGRLVHRYGGSPVGDFVLNPNRYLLPSIGHALFMDSTHDNPSPILIRSIYDLLPTSAIVAMSNCATGSTRGYDELVPHHIHVVNETRVYQSWGTYVNSKYGIIDVKRSLNLLHGEMATKGFTQIYVDQIDENILAITRHCPTTHESIILVAYTAFEYPENEVDSHVAPIKPLTFEGQLEEIILEAELYMKGDKPYAKPVDFVKYTHVINGYNYMALSKRAHIPLTQSKMFNSQAKIDGTRTKLEFDKFRPGSIVIIKVSLSENVNTTIKNLTKALRYRELESSFTELQYIVNEMNLADLSTVLFMCDAEEKDMGFGGGVYIIPNYGELVYCGLQGVISLLEEVAQNHDLGHPLCDNLREGNWMLDYISERLNHYEGTKYLSQWFRFAFDKLKKMPRYLIPTYFDIIITEAYNVLKERVFYLMSNFVKNGSEVVKLLALASLQFLVICKSAHLPQLSTALELPVLASLHVTLSAGLPHFSTGYMRCWGRDTFISLRGLMFLTGRFQEARRIILTYAQCLRHGLIPNLLNSGRNPRYNSRDAVWWWLYSIIQYIKESPQGIGILKDTVSRIYPHDNCEAYAPGQFDQQLIDVMQEALQVHFQGLIFRERNAGPDLDTHMTDHGFNNEIGVDLETGFVFGGNEWNCGTWMDKMGSAQKAGNRGYPATPRDGSAVELVGLQYAVLRFMAKLCEEGLIEYISVTHTTANDQKITWLYSEWADNIKVHFEKYFYFVKSTGEYKKFFYKDCFGSSKNGADFQLRCNFLIAMVVAPDLFNTQHAVLALRTVKEKLLGPLGIKTLDPDDEQYRGYYDNHDDSMDKAVAGGANYHQGPEWLWPMGYYLRARLIFAKKCGNLRNTIPTIWKMLRSHIKELKTSQWRGLPELTNENGTYCKDACRTQAWSVATIMEVLYDLHNLSK